MDRDPTNPLHSALMRDINGLLEYEGMVLPDREIIIAPEAVDELDAVDLVIGRNDAYGRTVCHVHRPSTEEFYWRHETFVAWDDGRSARFQINIPLNDAERMTMQELEEAQLAANGALADLLYNNVIDIDRAQAMKREIDAEMARVKNQVDEALMVHDETSDGDPVEVIRKIINDVETMAPINDPPDPKFDQLYAAVDRLRRAQYEAMAARALIIERYIELSDECMDAAEADPTCSADPAAVWNLLDMLDKIR